MNIIIDKHDLRDLVYHMLRELDDGKYVGLSTTCCGMLSAEKTMALDTLIKRIENYGV